ncbi:Protein of unknown function [Gryllus bimaculatus]|nr:Protein of unknown function [Gryllus bimaculatus]
MGTNFTFRCQTRCFDPDAKLAPHIVAVLSVHLVKCLPNKAARASRAACSAAASGLDLHPPPPAFASPSPFPASPGPRPVRSRTAPGYVPAAACTGNSAQWASDGRRRSAFRKIENARGGGKLSSANNKSSDMTGGGPLYHNFKPFVRIQGGAFRPLRAGHPLPAEAPPPPHPPPPAGGARRVPAPRGCFARARQRPTLPGTATLRATAAATAMIAAAAAAGATSAARGCPASRAAATRRAVSARRAWRAAAHPAEAVRRRASRRPPVRRRHGGGRAQPPALRQLPRAPESPLGSRRHRRATAPWTQGDAPPPGSGHLGTRLFQQSVTMTAKMWPDVSRRRPATPPHGGFAGDTRSISDDVVKLERQNNQTEESFLQFYPEGNVAVFQGALGFEVLSKR